MTHSLSRVNASLSQDSLAGYPARPAPTPITEPAGLVSINTHNKDIFVEQFRGRVQIVNRGASVELRTSRLPLNDIEVENHAGPIELTIPAQSEFQIEATARRGHVDSEFTELEVQRETESSWIRGKTGAARASIKLHTSYGTIRLKKLGSATTQAKRARRPRDRPMRRTARASFRLGGSAFPSLLAGARVALPHPRSDTE